MSMGIFVCPRCGKSGPRYIGDKNGKPYCRFCICFPSEEVHYFRDPTSQKPGHLQVNLTAEQEAISQKLVQRYLQGQNSLVHAVCGAGKTEIVFAVIEAALLRGDRVGFAIPRKDVVIELLDRWRTYFPSHRVIALYGDHHEETEGHLLLLTMHQLYRYSHYFDLLIGDEIDAFPFRDNDLLQQMFKRSVRGHYILMSATPPFEVLRQWKREDILLLAHRYHGYPIPVPRIELHLKGAMFLFLLRYVRRYIKTQKPCLIFVASKRVCESLFTKISMVIPNGQYVHAEKKDRSQMIKRFRQGKLAYLVTTTVLERGITISHLQVIVYHAEHQHFDADTLEQIAGRVGRKEQDPTGEVIFLGERETSAMVETIKRIRAYNQTL